MLVRAGKTVQAEGPRVDAVLEAVRRFGAESPQAVEADNELGMVLVLFKLEDSVLRSGQLER